MVTDDILQNLIDPYRAMAYRAHDLFCSLENLCHAEEAQKAKELLDFCIAQGEAPKNILMY